MVYSRQTPGKYASCAGLFASLAILCLVMLLLLWNTLDSNRNWLSVTPTYPPGIVFEFDKLQPPVCKFNGKSFEVQIRLRSTIPLNYITLDTDRGERLSLELESQSDSTNSTVKVLISLLDVGDKVNCRKAIVARTDPTHGKFTIMSPITIDSK